MQPKRRLNVRWLVTTSCLVALVLSYCLLWLRMITNPVQYTGADFITFYTVGTIGQRYGLQHVYDFNLQKDVEEEVVGFEIDPSNVLPHNHVPFINPVLVLLVMATGGKYIPGFIVWDLLLIGLYVLAMVVILKMQPDTLERNALNVTAIFLFFPIFVSILNAQDTALLVLGAAGLFYGRLRERDWAAGLGLALMTVRPHIALLLALPFLFRNRRVFWWFCAGAAFLVAISVLQLGVTGVKDFVSILFDTAVRSRETAMVNFIGLVRRLLPGLDAGIIRWAGWILFFLTMAILCVVWRKCKQVDGRILSLALLASLFVAPHLVYHDLALLLFPLLMALGMALERKTIGRKDVSLVLLVISVVLMLSFVAEAAQYFFPYLLMAVLAVYLWKPEEVTTRLRSLFRGKEKLVE